MQQNNQRQSPLETVQQPNQKLLGQPPLSPSDKQQLQVNDLSNNFIFNINKLCDINILLRKFDFFIF